MQKILSPALPRWRLRLEFLMFYLVAPVVMAVFLPPSWMFRMLFCVCVVGMILLILTPGFHWKELFYNRKRIDWRFVGICTVLTAILSYGIVMLTHPEAAFVLPLKRPHVMLMIAALYPLISALPQELIYRALFFRRYAGLLPQGRGALVANALIFSFAHLLYWSWIVLALTFVAGLVFAHCYHTRQNFPQAVALHAIAGVVLFAIGMGVYFYSGNVVRPF